MKLSADLDEIINQKGNMRLFFNGTSPQYGESVVQVRFGSSSSGSNGEHFGVEHVIMLRSGFPPSRTALDQVYCLFPNTRNEKRRILAAHRYVLPWPLGGGLETLNIAINEALADSPAQTSHGGSTRFALAYGGNVVGFGAVEGTLYLVWAQTVTLYSAAKTAVRIVNDVPLLVNMNGEALITGIYMLEPRAKASAHTLPMIQRDDVRTPTLLGDHAALWVYEKRPERSSTSAGAMMRVMGYEDAVNFATRPSRNTQEWLAMDVRGNSEIELDEDAPPVPYDWLQTPNGLFVAEPTSLALHSLGSSDGHFSGLDARDPFQEYEEQQGHK